MAAIPTITAIKMPLPSGEDLSTQLVRLWARVPTSFHIGYSGDWGAADALLAGSNAWYSVVAGLLPTPALALTRAAEAGETAAVRRLDDAFRPLWDLFKAHGSLRVMYEVADRLLLCVGEPPLPLRRLEAAAAEAVGVALAGLTEAA